MNTLQQLEAEQVARLVAARPVPPFQPGDTVRVSGTFSLHELRQRLGLQTLDAGDVDTVGGYLTQQLGRWPRPGDEVVMDSYTARVVTVQRNRVTQVVLKPRLI